MRITKAELQEILARAAAFNRLRIKVLPVGRTRDRVEEVVRNRSGFIHAAQYGRGMLPLRDEIGTDGITRFIKRVY